MADLYRVAVVGGPAVGKSSLTIQFIQNHFVEEYDPTIEDSFRKGLTVDSQTCVLEVLDTCNEDGYSSMRGHTSMRDQYFHADQGFLVLYSITSRASFEETRTIREQLCRMKQVSRFPMCLVATKCDLENEREIPTQEGQDMAQNLGAPFFEISAKTRTNVDEVFFEIVREIRRSITAAAENGSKKPAVRRGANCVIS